MSIDSAPEQGTTVHLFLRASTLRPVAVPEPSRAPERTAPRLARMPVLYVEDKKLYFVKRQLDEGPVAQLTYTFEGMGGGGGSDDRGALENFEPKMSCAGQANKCGQLR